VHLANLWTRIARRIAQIKADMGLFCVRNFGTVYKLAKGDNMRTGRNCVRLIAAIFCCIIEPAFAQPAAPQPVFACSLGKKSVSVTAEGVRLTYIFGTAAKTEMSIVGSAALKNVWYREARYAGMEHQLRFANGDYSYIVYNMEGNGRSGASASSGLVVMKGKETVADMPCAHYAEFGTGFDLRALPEDTDDYSAM